MARVKGGTVARARRKKTLKEAKGYFGSKHRLYKTAKEQLLHSGVYAYRDRRQKKRDFRKLWITRINAACRENEISYSKFMNGLNKAGLMVNRKMLSELAIDNKEAFTDLVAIAKDALEGKEYKPAKVALEKKTTKEEKVEVKEKKTAAKKTEAKEEKKATAKKTVKEETAKKATKTTTETKKTTSAKKTTTTKKSTKKEEK
jgi:large subunit ribosomal protein L20